MLKKLWGMRIQFIRYFAIGISGVILDVGSIYLLTKYAHFGPVASVVINQLFILNYVFYLNKKFAFASKGVAHKQAIRFYMVAGLNYLIGVAWMTFFTKIVNFYPYLAKYMPDEKLYYSFVRMANVALAVSWNFFLYKFFVYKEEIDVHNSPSALD